MRNLFVKITFILCTLLLSTNSVWALKKFYAQCAVESKPAVGGFVSIWQNAKEDKVSSFTTETTDQTGTKESGWQTNGTSSYTFDFFGYQVAAPGYTFQYWSTNPNATSGITEKEDHWYDWWSQNCQYYNLTVTSRSSNSNSPTVWKYYAFFTPNTYTVNFNANGGSVSPTSNTVTYDATYETLPTPTRSGYTFAGWWTATSGGTQVTASTQVKITSAQTLYAHWTANNYTITLKSDLATSHGTGSIAVTFDSNTNLTSAITCPSRDKWTFWGYFTGENGEGTQIIDRYGNINANVSGFTDSNKKWKYADNLALYAHLTEKSNQTITWDNITNGQEYATGTMGAIASSGLTVTYSYKDNCDDWAYINENNRLVVLVPNKTVTITAHQEGNDYYNEAEPVSRTFVTLGANPNQTTEITASGITYGQTLSNSALSGNVKLDGVVIPGTLSWVDPSIMPNAGTANHMVLFTPTNTDAYSSIYFEVPVTVAKATPVITWNISNILRETTKYCNFITSTNKEKNLSFTDVSSKLSISGLNLLTGGVTSVQTVSITVSQAASDNYNAYPATTKTFTLYPKVEQCLPVVLSAASDGSRLDNMGAVYDNSVWCSSNNPSSSPAYDTYEILGGEYQVRYTQTVGIALGTWRDGFTGLSLAKIADLLWDLVTGGEVSFKWSTKSIELSFTGIPDKLSFTTELQTVGFKIATWHDVTPTAAHWKVYERGLGESYDEDHPLAEGDGAISVDENLKESTRYIKIVYTGNFAGFVKNLRITRKKSLTADKSELTFGTEDHPLQEPQTITLSYSSLGVCGGMEDAITVTSSNPEVFYVDETTITENVGIEQKGSYTVRVRCNDVHQSGTITFTANVGPDEEIVLNIPVNSTDPATRVITATPPTAIFQTGTEHNPVSGTAYRTQRTHNFEACFNGSTPLFDTLYIYGVSESAVDTREWEYSPAKGYKVPVVTASNVHTPCFVYKKDGTQYTYVRTYDASTKTLNIADSKKCGFVGYRAEAPAANAIQVSGANAELYLNNTEIIASGAPLAVNATSKVYANGANILSSTSNAAVKLSGATTLSIEDTWTGAATSAILALRPASDYPSIDLGSANGRVDINGTQLELHNATNMAIAHMSGTTEKFDGEVHINDGSVGGAATLGMPKLTFIDGGTFNDGIVVAYTLNGVAKLPRNSRGEIVSRQTMTKTALEAYDWYGQSHLTLDGSAKVNPMLMDEEVWIFNGTNSDHSDDATSWNKGSVPGETADVLINAPMVISGGELKVKSLTINWEDKGKGIPAVTVNPDGGLTVGEGGIDAIKLANPAENLVLRADQELSSATKGQTGFLRIHPASAEPMPKATVELYSTTWYNKANEAGNTTRFQCAGIPIADKGVVASTVFPTGTLLYAWNESSEKWTNSRTKELVPFKGYDLSQKLSNDGLLVTFTGTLASGDTTIDLAHTSSEKGFNLLANSYTAPISIEEFIDDDFVNASQTIYILNAGTKAESNAQAGGLDAAGKWVGIPAKTAPELAAEGYPCVIPSMQGFWVQSTGAGAQLKLNYDRLVMGVTYTEPTANKPLRVAKSRETEQAGKLMINLYTETDADCVFILESDSYDTAYEDGYDARKIASETMDLFTIRDDERLGVDATNSIEGTRVGVRTGEETTYTFRFSHLQSDKDLVLWDKETKMKVFIDEDIEYTFYAVPNSEITERFQIVAANIPTITTGVDEIESETHIQKFIKDNQLYILKDGVLYNATGAVVRK